MTIDWQEIEEKSGKTLPEAYKEIKNLKNVGIFYGKYWGVEAISYFAIRAEMKRRGLPVHKWGGNRSRLNWETISNKMGYTDETTMHNDLYWGQGMSYAVETEYINNVIGEDITPATMYYRFNKLGIKRRSRGGYHPKIKGKLSKQPVAAIIE